jgi:hypothetical protein
MKRLSLIVVMLIVSLGARAEFDKNSGAELLKFEPAEKDLLVKSAVPELKENCECVQPHKEGVAKGDAKAIEQVSLCFSVDEENKCNKNLENHFAWSKAAATRGRIMAEYSVAFAYVFGSGVKADPKLAADWFAQTARQNLPSGYFFLAKAYEEGAGRTKNLSHALQLYKFSHWLGYELAKTKVDELEKAANSN